MDIYESYSAELIVTGGNYIQQFESLPGERMCIGGKPAEIFYESLDMSVETKTLYAFGKGAGGDISPPALATCVVLKEIV